MSAQAANHGDRAGDRPLRPVGDPEPTATELARERAKEATERAKDARDAAKDAKEAAKEAAKDAREATTEAVKEKVQQYRYGVDAILTPANVITIVRLLFSIPVLWVIADRGASWLALVGWIIVAGTDWLDGYVARRDGITRSGAFLDPLADKILVLGGFAALVVAGIYWWVPVAIVFGREIVISIWRSLAARRGISLPALYLGKLKAVVQFVAVAIAVAPFLARWGWISTTALWVAVGFTVVSGLEILRHGWRDARLRSDEA